MRTGFEAAAAEALEKLERLGAGRVGSGRLLSVTVEAPVDDVCGRVMAARDENERWFCWEQPDRRGFALAALGEAATVEVDGSERFVVADREVTELLADRIADEPGDLPAGAGPLVVGGFAFADDGGESPEWVRFGSGLLILPRVVFWREGDRATLTVSAVAGKAGDATGEITDGVADATRILTRLQGVNPGLAAIGAPSGFTQGEGGEDGSGERYVAGVEKALDRIADGELQKIVVARRKDIAVTDGAAGAAGADLPGSLFTALRDRFPACFVFATGQGESAFVGASPELLVRRRGAGLDTVALAGSAARGTDAEDDRAAALLRASAKNRHEHELVRRRIERVLAPISVWVQTEDEPSVARVANIQHLATPVHAQLSEPHSTIELVGRLHPTPAVAGEPVEEAVTAIAAIEDFDRGWYAGPLGWMDAAFDGEFCVALRSALIDGSTARLYAGAGIVAGSKVADELAETDLKLGALLPILRVL